MIDPTNWIFLDSCSSADIVANPRLLRNIHKSDREILIKTLSGTVTLTHCGTLGSYPHAVWYHPGGPVNIMSLNRVTAAYDVTINSRLENCITVHLSRRHKISFRPSVQGIYQAPISQTMHHWCMLSTVKDNAGHFTQQSVRRAKRARKMQSITMFPTSRRMKEVGIEAIKNCPITRADIIAADTIFGPPLGALKGKTVRTTPAQVNANIDPVPTEILSHHCKLTLLIDIMFVNKVPFFVTMSRDLKFITVDPIPNRQVNTVAKSLATTISLYKSRGFKITSILADYEFEPLREHHPILNTAAEDEHVGDIERCIRTIKERTRCRYQTLPYKRIPRIMLIHLVRNAVFWLNAFPAEDGVGGQHSPRYVMTGRHISYDKHVQLEFGSYVARAT